MIAVALLLVGVLLVAFHDGIADSKMDVVSKQMTGIFKEKLNQLFSANLDKVTASYVQSEVSIMLE